MTVNDHIIKNMPILNTDSSSALYDMGYNFGQRFTPAYAGVISAITSATPGVVTVATLTPADGNPIYFLNNSHTGGVIDFLSQQTLTISAKAGGGPVTFSPAAGGAAVSTAAYSAWAASDGGVVSTNWVGYKDHDISQHQCIDLTRLSGSRNVATNAVLVSNIGPVNIFVQQASPVGLPSAWAGVLIQPGAALHFSSGAGASLRVFDHTATARYSITSYG
tara:strand:- start:416 stop:1075 length:660 start_codon:yes stop_codon:yes gene_type:complete